MLWSSMVSEEITSPQFAVLNGIARRAGTDQRSLGAEASLDRSTVADVVARLVQRGLVERVRDSADARRNVLQLTKQGRAAHKKLMVRTARMIEVMTAPLDTGERDELLRLMSKLVLAGEALRDSA